MEMSHQSQRIAELENQLISVEVERDNNKAAADILTKFMEDGEVEQDASGEVKVSKRRPGMPNLISNLDEL